MVKSLCFLEGKFDSRDRTLTNFQAQLPDFRNATLKTWEWARRALYRTVRGTLYTLQTP